MEKQLREIISKLKQVKNEYFFSMLWSYVSLYLRRVPDAEPLPDGCCLSPAETNPLKYLLIESPCCSLLTDRYDGGSKQKGRFSTFPHGFHRVRNVEFKIHGVERV